MLWFVRLRPSREGPDNLFADQPAVLDEDLGDLVARRHTARHKDAGHRGLERFGIDRRPSRLRIERDPHPREQLEVGVETDQWIHTIGWNMLFVAERDAHDYLAGRDLGHLARHSRLDLALLDAVLEIRAEPILHTLGPGLAAVDDGGASAGTKQLQRRLDRRVLAADHHGIAAVGEMRFVEVVMDVRQLLAPHAEAIGRVEVAGGEHEFVPRNRLTAEARGDFAGRDELRVGLDADTFGAGDPAVVLERFLPRGFRPGTDERVIADLEPLRRRKERHVDGIADDRIDERARIDHERIDAAAFGGDRARQTNRPGAGDDHGFVLHETGIYSQARSQAKACARQTLSLSNRVSCQAWAGRQGV